ncbi:hypothetical protein CRG98_010749 [Punica granatum]|uniref:Uncharacterized protein n=1 Tax=Punica granatum TaxID=22663 RepID=A0A2I0KK56_PUNGR|nr:hypothetical protein CRG98_010749 [Punica granatum]
MPPTLLDLSMMEMKEDQTFECMQRSGGERQGSTSPQLLRDNRAPEFPIVFSELHTCTVDYSGIYSVSRALPTTLSSPAGLSLGPAYSSLTANPTAVRMPLCSYSNRAEQSFGFESSSTSTMSPSPANPAKQQKADRASSSSFVGPSIANLPSLLMASVSTPFWSTGSSGEH